ncbi:hypothetical protein IWQ60_007600, partial [Tieghemiomyces parasiticus]
MKVNAVLFIAATAAALFVATPIQAAPIDTLFDSLICLDASALNDHPPAVRAACDSPADD